MTSLKALLALLLVAATAVADQVPHGTIKVCRRPGVASLKDHKPVMIPAGTYTGACNSMGERCRNIVVTTTSSAVLSAQQSCVTIDATLTQADGKPLKAGETLVSQWNITGFEPAITVATAFK